MIEAPRHLTLEVRAPTGADGRFWHYDVTPSVGEVRIKETGLGYPQRPRVEIGKVHCSRARESVSPSHQWLARCAGERFGQLGTFVIENESTKTVVFRWRPATFRLIHGFAWAPNSTYLALLTESGRIGTTSLFDWFGKSIGHPLSYMTVFLEILNVTSGQTNEYLIRRDVRQGESSILDWVN